MVFFISPSVKSEELNQIMKKLFAALTFILMMFTFVGCNTSSNPFNEQQALSDLGPEAKLMNEQERAAYLSRKRAEHEAARTSSLTAKSRNSEAKRRRMGDVSTPTLINEERRREMDNSRTGSGGIFSFFERNW